MTFLDFCKKYNLHFVDWETGRRKYKAQYVLEPKQ